MKRYLLAFLLLFSVSLTYADIRYVFYLIGDGMGPNQVLAAEMYRAELAGRIGRDQLGMTSMPYSGQASTYSLSNGITDSSAAGTCLASGKKTKNGHLGTTPDNQPIENIAEQLHRKGWSIGIMTTVAIDHATPGAFYAHVADRNEYYTIGTQLANSEYEFFGGAGFHQPENKSVWNAPNLYDLCEQKGYTFAHGFSEGQKNLSAEKLILLQPQDGIDRSRKCESIPYSIDQNAEDLKLSQITQTAIDFLYAKNKPFFMMIEGGKIDYAGHSNDGATNILETIDFDNAVQVALRFYAAHPDETLIVVTADHETGGMALGNSDYTLNLQILRHQHVSSWVLGQKIKDLMKSQGKKMKWEDVESLLRTDLDFNNGVTLTEAETKSLKDAYMKMMSGKSKTTKTLYQDIDELTGLAVGILNTRSKLGWTTHAHTAATVPVFAIGKGAQVFTGWHDNTELAPLILKTVGL